MKKPCLNYYIDLALNRFVSICDFEIQYYERQPGHTAYNNMDCLTCVVLNILYAQCYSLKPYYNKCIDMVCLFVCFDVSKKITTLKERLVTMFTLKRFPPLCVSKWEIQWNGFFSVCVIIYHIRLLLFEKLMSHWLQIYGLSRVCALSYVL